MSDHEIYLREYLSVLFSKAADTIDLLEAELKRQDGTGLSDSLERLRTDCRNNSTSFKQTGAI